MNSGKDYILRDCQTATSTGFLPEDVSMYTKEK